MIGAKLASLLAALLAAISAIAVAAVSADDQARTIGVGQIKYRGLGPERWAQRWRHEHHELQQMRVRLRRLLAVRLEAIPPQMAIRLVFGDRAAEAVAVAGCETGGTFSTSATNGQYLGLFQMGSSERARYGYGSSPFAQTLGAYVYFVVSGRDWSPWACGWAAHR